MAEKIIVGCWTVLFLFWSNAVLSRGQRKAAAERTSWRERARYLVPVLAAAALLLGYWGSRALERRLLPQDLALQSAGAALAVLGLVGALWARHALGGNRSPERTYERTLVREGPYRWVRNPIYTSILLLFAGSALAGGHIREVAALVFITAGLWIKLKQEEPLLLRKFPEEYPEYRRRVRALVPFVF